MTVVRSNFILTLLFSLAMGLAGAQITSPTKAADVSSSASIEDYASASLARSSLHADSPEVVDVDEEPNYVREWITVQWRPDDPIYLYVVRPRRVEKPPVVMYLYDYPAENDVYRDEDWCERATAGGYAAVGFVPALNGNRYHGRPMKEWFVSELQESLAKSAHDVQMVLNYLEGRGDLDMHHAGIYGVGAGATISLLAASVDSRISAIDLIDPWGDWSTWMRGSDVVSEEERPLYLKQSFLERIAVFDPVAVLAKLGTPHIRLVQFRQGSVTPKVSREHIAAVLPAKAEHEQFASFAEFEGAKGHNDPGLEWIKTQLGPARAATKSASAASIHKEESR